MTTPTPAQCLADRPDCPDYTHLASWHDKPAPAPAPVTCTWGDMHEDDPPCYGCLEAEVRALREDADEWSERYREVLLALDYLTTDDADGWRKRAIAAEADRNGWEQTANEHGMALAKAEAALRDCLTMAEAGYARTRWTSIRNRLRAALASKSTTVPTLPSNLADDAVQSKSIVGELPHEEPPPTPKFPPKPNPVGRCNCVEGTGKVGGGRINCPVYAHRAKAEQKYGLSPTPPKKKGEK